MHEKFGYLRQDNSSHWYLIPEENLGLFDKLNVDWASADGWESIDEWAKFEEISNRINDEFGKYRLGGGVENLRIPMKEVSDADN